MKTLSERYIDKYKGIPFFNLMRVDRLPDFRLETEQKGFGFLIEVLDGENLNCEMETRRLIKINDQLKELETKHFPEEGKE